MKIRDIKRRVNESAEDGYVRVSKQEFERIAKSSGAEWVYHMGALMLNGKEIGYRKEVDREEDNIWYDYYVRSDMMQEASLPPHLAKFVGADGDFTPDVKARLGKAGERRLITQPIGSLAKDVTPKGYGPEETDESLVTEADNVHATYLFSMSKPDYENPANTDTKYVKMDFMVMPGGVAHPQALSRQIDENPTLRDLRKQGYINFKTVASWKNDLDSELADAHEKLNSGKNWLESYRQQLQKTVNTLSQAKKIMNGNEVLEGVREAGGSPHDTIRKFLDQKAAQERRSTSLARDPAQVKMATPPPAPKKLEEYKPGITVLSRTITLEPDEIATLKKVRWPYGIEMSVRHDQVTFRTAKIKTLAKILNKYIDFGATDVGTVLNIPAEIGPIGEDSMKDQGGSGNAAAGGTVKRLKTGGWWAKNHEGTMRTFPAEKEKAARTFADSGERAEEIDEVDGYAANGAELLIAQNGKLVQKLKLPLDPKMHHIAQELRKLNLGLNDFEMTSAARDLAGGRTYRKDTLAMQLKASTPTEMR